MESPVRNPPNALRLTKQGVEDGPCPGFQEPGNSIGNSSNVPV